MASIRRSDVSVSLRTRTPVRKATIDNAPIAPRSYRPSRALLAIGLKVEKQHRTSKAVRIVAPDCRCQWRSRSHAVARPLPGPQDGCLGIVNQPRAGRRSTKSSNLRKGTGEPGRDYGHQGQPVVLLPKAALPDREVENAVSTSCHVHLPSLIMRRPRFKPDGLPLGQGQVECQVPFHVVSSWGLA